MTWLCVYVAVSQVFAGVFLPNETRRDCNCMGPRGWRVQGLGFRDLTHKWNRMPELLASTCLGPRLLKRF